MGNENRWKYEQVDISLIDEAEMNANKPAAITIKNETNGCVFSYGMDAVIDGSVYQRQQEGSSLLYDVVGGSMQVQEISDKPVQTTRSLH